MSAADIRAFETADAAAVSDLISRTLRTSNARDYSEDFLSKVEAALDARSLRDLAKKRLIFVAVDGATIVGTATLGEDQVHAVFVHPARQGRGIGRRLMEVVESQARTRGDGLLTLYASLGAIPFYETLGWRAVREHVDGDARLVVMTKRLTSVPDRREPGKIILLNGPSSAGKSTLARALQQQLPEPFLHWSFDHLRESGALPMARIRSGELDWARMRPAVFDGFHRSLPAFARAGNNLIVDHIIEQEEWLAHLVRLLTPFDVFFVGVHCPVAELERREQQRGNRRSGEARRDFDTVHRFREYDLDIDAMQPAEDNVARLIAAWRARSRPTAFERIAAHRRVAVRGS